MSVEFDVVFDDGASFDVELSAGDSGGNIFADEHFQIDGALGDLTDVDLTSPTDGQVLSYDEDTGKWVNADGGGGGGGSSPSPSNDTPSSLGVAAAGSSSKYSRGDHVHPMPSASDVGALPSSTTIPSKTSELQNDSGFITSAPVSSVNSQTGAVVLDAGDLAYSDNETYTSGTVGDAIADLKGDLNGKYSLPSGGIPSSDMASAVQTSLGKADAAIPAPSSPSSGQFLVYNGSAWVAQTLSTWQGGNY